MIEVNLHSYPTVREKVKASLLRLELLTKVKGPEYLDHQRIRRYVRRLDALRRRRQQREPWSDRLRDLELSAYHALVMELLPVCVSPDEARPIPEDVVREVQRRDAGRCAVCDDPVDTGQIDHVIPAKVGGPPAPWNLQLTCRGCNARKHDHIRSASLLRALQRLRDR